MESECICGNAYHLPELLRKSTVSTCLGSSCDAIGKVIIHNDYTRLNVMKTPPSVTNTVSPRGMSVKRYNRRPISRITLFLQ